MDKRDSGLERLCKVYLGLNDGEKEKIIRLAEGLLNSQKAIPDEGAVLARKNEDTDLKIV